MSNRYPIVDNHMHLDPRGRRLGAVEDFVKAGGTHLILVHKPYGSLPSLDRIISDMRTTTSLCEEINRQTRARAFCVVGPHPVELVHLAEKYGLQEAMTLMKKAVDNAADLICEKKAIAFGEIGRPHFKVSESMWEASNEVMRYVMTRAKELGCSVVFHTENGPAPFRFISKLVDELGLEGHHMIKHFSAPVAVREENNHGIFPSVVARRKAVRTAVTEDKGKGRFFLETDYIDSPERPDVVLPPAAGPSVTHLYHKAGIFTDELIGKVHCDNFKTAYGIDIEL